jgi:mono/diheme cytochrome c family protein
MKSSIFKVKWIITALTLPMLAVAILFPVSSNSVSATPQDTGATYKAKCASCHGADGGGGTAVGKKMKLRDLRAAEVQKQTDAQLQTIIGKGKGKMIGYEKSLGADQVKQLTAYVRQLGKKS